MGGAPLFLWCPPIRFQNCHRRLELRPLRYRSLTFSRNRTEHCFPVHAPMNAQLPAIPRIVPPPCSYSRRTCSVSSTSVLLSTPGPPLSLLSPEEIHGE